MIVRKNYRARLSTFGRSGSPKMKASEREVYDPVLIGVCGFFYTL
jgi:hypothetical protein